MMEIAGLMLVVIGLYVLYHVIRLAVRDGILAARDVASERRPAAEAGSDDPTE